MTDLQQTLNLLGEAAQFDVCSRAGRPMPDGKPADALERHVEPLIRSDGKRIPVLKVLQTSACAKDCYYCPFRAGRDFRRAAMKPEDLARATDELYRRGKIQGLFLSSGIVGKGEYTQEQIVKTAEILRSVYNFRGYLHLKLMPGSSEAAIERTMALADRVSTNLEAPTAEALERLSGTKDLDSLLDPLKIAHRVAVSQGKRVSRTTQFVVGPGGESDRDLLARTSELYTAYGLARAYYSAFRPIVNTPLDGLEATPAQREHHLYQADFLMRQYGYAVDELPFDPAGNLPIDQDPKVLWAQTHSDRFPVEVNRAARETLLRVPGIGPLSADRILAARRVRRVQSVEDLARLGVSVKRALPYILLDGKRPPHQLSLFGI